MKNKEPSSRKILEIHRHHLFISVILVVVLGSLILFLLSYIMNYVPRPTDFTSEIDFNMFSNFFYKYEVVRYPSGIGVIHAEQGQERLGIGVVTDPWNLKFGVVPEGGSSSRFMELVNLGDKRVKIIFRSYGNISKYLGFSMNNFILNPGDNVTVKVTFGPTPTTANGVGGSGVVGNYTGEIDRIVKIPKYGFLYAFM